VDSTAAAAAIAEKTAAITDAWKMMEARKRRDGCVFGIIL
jgi:hypothetical protein